MLLTFPLGYKITTFTPLTPRKPLATAPPVSTGTNTGMIFNPIPNDGGSVSSNNNSALLAYDDVKPEANCRASSRPVTFPPGLHASQVFYRQYSPTGKERDKKGTYDDLSMEHQIHSLAACQEIGGEHWYMVIVAPGNQEAGRYMPLPPNSMTGGKGNPCFSCNSFLPDGTRENKGYMSMRNLKNCHNYDTDPIKGHGCTVDGQVKDFSITMSDGSRQAPSPDFNTYVAQMQAAHPITEAHWAMHKAKQSTQVVQQPPVVGQIQTPVELTGAVPTTDASVANELEKLPF